MDQARLILILGEYYRQISRDSGASFPRGHAQILLKDAIEIAGVAVKVWFFKTVIRRLLKSSFLMPAGWQIWQAAYLELNVFWYCCNAR